MSSFCGRMHTMLRNFVDSARGRLLVEAEELIERSGALADRVRLLDSLRHIDFRQNHGVTKL